MSVLLICYFVMSFICSLFVGKFVQVGGS